MKTKSPSIAFNESTNVISIGNEDVATFHPDRKEVSPIHGYYPRHPYAKRVKAWAKRRGYKTPLY